MVAKNWIGPIADDEIVKKRISKTLEVTKVCLLGTYLGKSVHTKNHKNCPVDIIDYNGAIFCYFLGEIIFEVRSLKTDFIIPSRIDP